MRKARAYSLDLVTLECGPVATVFHTSPEGHWGRTYTKVTPASMERINRLFNQATQPVGPYTRPRYRVENIWVANGFHVSLSRWPNENTWLANGLHS